MQKKLASLLSCSLLFLLCCADSCDARRAKGKSPKPSHTTTAKTSPTKNEGAKKKHSQKAKNDKKNKKSRKTQDKVAVAALYNENSNSHLPEISDATFNKLTYLDEQHIADFDVAQIDYDNNPLNVFSEADKEALNKEISDLVSLWQAQDEASAADNSFDVDFRALYLDADKSIIPTTAAPHEQHHVAQAPTLPDEEHALTQAPDAPEFAPTVKTASADLPHDADQLPQSDLVEEREVLII